jgi:hypothetical protein
VRQIFLEDAITKHHKGYSPVRERQIIAKRYSYLNGFTNLSLCAAIVSGFFAFNKTYTGRSVYYFAFGGTLCVFLLMNYIRDQKKKCVINELQCDDKSLKEFVDFYKNANIDTPSYFEEDKKEKH